MKEKENISLSSPISSINSKLKFDEDNANENLDICISPKLKQNTKKHIFNNNLLRNQISTNNDTYQLTKNIIIEEEMSSFKENTIEEKKEEIIKRDPIITKVNLTKFYPKTTKNRNFNNIELVKKAINTVRTNYKNNTEEKIKNKNIEQNKKIHTISNQDKLKNKETKKLNDTDNNYKDNNCPNSENLLNNYKKILKEIETHENKKIKLKINYNDNLEIGNNKSKKIKDNLLLTKSKSKPNIIEENNKINNTKSFNIEKIKEIMMENEALNNKNLMLNNEIKKLNVSILEQNSEIENYKTNIKINEEQIKYLTTLKESNIISQKDKDIQIEELKNKIFSLEKEIIDKKEEIKALNEIINLNKKEELNKNNNDYELIINELQNLKMLLSEKNNIIENLQNNNNNITDLEEEKEKNELRNLNVEYQEEINELNKRLELKDNEINKMRLEYQNICDSLNDMKIDYENLYKKYLKQNDVIEEYIKNNNENNKDDGTIDKEIFDDNNNKNINDNNSCINYDHLSRTKNLLNKRDNIYIDFNKSNKKNNKSFENIRLSNNNINTFYKYGNEKEEFYKKEDLVINTDKNEDDLNYFNNIDSKRILTPNRFNVNYNKNIFKMENPLKNNICNTSNYFYMKKKDIFKLNELTDYIDNANHIIKSYNENYNNSRIISDINFSENAISKYPNIYTLVGSTIIGFNLKKKKFMLLKPIDKTNNLFNGNINILRKYNILPTTLNHLLGFFILLNNYLFFYSYINNTLNTLTELTKNHWNGGFISIKNDLYIISGIETTQCEQYSLDSKKILFLPSVNYKRVNSGICNVNDEYIYTLFGRDSETTIERLNIGKIKEGGQNWELIRIKIEGENDLNMNNLQQFLSFYNEENIIILGGDYNIKNENQEILRLNIKENSLNKIGAINFKSSYLNQIIFIDEEYFSVYDINNGLHFFNKDLDKHLIFNFQV